MVIETLIPNEVIKIIETLNVNGYDAFIVGGCVRDSFLMKAPSDWDITTSATPEQTKKIFKKTIDTGIKHGTLSVLSGKDYYEVTTYRLDGCYSDNRRPDNVIFTNSLKEDLSRRDFTINAMAYHPEHGLIDPFNGQNDLKNKIIRAVGDCNNRFTEDALRMLRAIRFSAQLNFDIDETTFNSIKSNSILINKVSNERIRDELTKILVSNAPQKINLLKESFILEKILPEFYACYNITQNHPYHIHTVANHSLLAAECVEKNVALRWTMLLHDIGKLLTKTTDDNYVDHFYGHSQKSIILAESILRRLKFDNKIIDKILRLIKYHDYSIEVNNTSVRRAINAIGDDIFEDYLKVKAADIKSQNPLFTNKNLDILSQINTIYQTIKAQGHCTSIKDLAISGNDLIEIGFTQGKVIGNVLHKLLEIVLENPELNTKTNLLEIVFSHHLNSDQ